MRDGEEGNWIKLAGYAAAVTLLAVWLSPVAFQGGKALAEVSLDRPTNRMVDEFARWAEGAGFPGFFVLTFLGFSLLLLPPVAKRLWPGVLPARSLFVGGHQWRVVCDGVRGFGVVLGAGVVVALLRGAGWHVDGWSWVIASAFGMAWAFEWVFRGVVFGVLEKMCRPAVVVGVSALVFTGFRLILPPPDFVYGDPESWTLGWQMLKRLPGYGLENACAVLSLFGWGVLLGIARLTDRSLWSPFFLHAGWLVAIGWFDGAVGGWISWATFCAGLGWVSFVRKRHAMGESD